MHREKAGGGRVSDIDIGAATVLFLLFSPKHFTYKWWCRGGSLGGVHFSIEI